MKYLAKISCLASMAACVCRADVTFYDIFYTRYFQQTTESAPDTPVDYAFAARIINQVAGEVGDASLEIPGGGEPIALATTSGTYWYFASNFGTEGEMTAAFPAGIYTHSIEAGTLGTASAVLSRPQNLFFAQTIPAFDADTFNRFTGFPSDQDVPLSFSGFFTPDGATLALIFVTIFDHESGEVVFNTLLANDQTECVVSAGTLQPGRGYDAALYYSSRIEIPLAGFSAATSIVGCDLATSATLTTRSPCPCDLNGDGLVEDSDFVLFVGAYNILDCTDPSMPVGCPADFNADAVVDDSDFVIFVAAYNELLCP